MLYILLSVIIVIEMIAILMMHNKHKEWIDYKNRELNENIVSKNKEIDELSKKHRDENNILQKQIVLLNNKKAEMARQFEDEARRYKGEVEKLNKQLSPRLALLEVAGSNLTAIPYMAGIMADYETYGIENLAASLNWGFDQQRLKKVKSIRSIREDARLIVEQNKGAQYQLAYLLELYPGLQDILETDYQQLPVVSISALEDRDTIHNYLSKDEYESLGSTERSQLALQRYIASHTKTKWQIGRDYELYIGYRFSQSGVKDVEYTGEELRLEDLGRDLIVHQQNGDIIIVQCKYWSESKTIHEKHITQLYGTTMCYSIENNIPVESVRCLLVTNTTLSVTAKRMAQQLNVEVWENIPMGDFPRIKCNNGKDEYGCNTKIYHLPFDQQYDYIKMKHKDDFWAFTAQEAEQAGYRRAMRWYGD